MEMLEMVSGAVPLLASVTTPGVHVWFTCVSGSVNEVAERVSCAVDPPVPLNVTVCGLPGALSVIAIEPDLGPVAVGVKVIVSVQFAPTATEPPQLLVTAKSPLGDIFVMVNGPVPELVKVTVCAALVVPTF